MSRFKISFFVLYTGLLFSQKTDNRLSKLDSDIENLMESFHTVGLSIAIVENDTIIYNQSFGYRDLENKLLVDGNTMFPIGSVTKPFTAALIGIHEGQGKLSIKDRPVKHLDYLQFNSDEMNNLVTIEDLLAHRSGIGVVDAAHVFFPKKSVEEHLRRLPHLHPNSAVRERFDYSNMGYAILGAISSAVSQKTWSENITRVIFEPLEMSKSNTSLAQMTESDNYAFGYSVANKKEVVKVLYEDQHESAAAGAINSTITDMSKWMLMLLHGGVYKHKQIIPKAYLERSFSEHNILNTSFSFDKKYTLLNDCYGYGWFNHTYNGLYRVNHGGNVSGFTASINMYPYKNIGIVILTNQSSANLLHNAIVDIITNRLLYLEQKKWTDYEVSYGDALTFNEPIAPINQTKKPSHPLSGFSGKYLNKGHGILEIIKANDGLQVIFPVFDMGLEHLYHNVFMNKPITEIHQNVPSFYFNFMEDNTGTISKLSINFQTTPVIFKKISNN
ncbi:serine hydrolase [uncultured Croceitalea sp.]|uniref:serine hydrolase n=1 Tax=uncultured Croceitalea sp. TaxID=1798908 RepID=UPI0033060703